MTDDEMLSRTVGDADVVRRVFDEQAPFVLALEGPEYRVVATTASYRAYAGRSEIIGVPLQDAFPETIGQHIFDIIDHVYRTGEPAFLKEFRVHFEHGVGGPVEIFLELNIRPRRTPDGRTYGLLIDLADQTEQVHERRAAQQRAVDAEQRYAAARNVIHTLQAALLPAGVPVLPQAQVAATYLLADADTAAGGDWFDAMTLPGGGLALVVGDVVGHGVGASAVMGQLRILVQERLTATGDITTAVRAVDRMAACVPGAHAATVCVVVLDPVSGDLTYCTAGHPPPLVLPHNGDGRYLTATGGRPLGVGPAGDATVRVGRDRLEPGDMIVLYTDGILERPGRALPRSTVEFAQVASDVAAGRAMWRDPGTATERVCTQTLELLIRMTGHGDDITLLAAQRTEPPATFEMSSPAELSELRHIRSRLTAWAAALDVPAPDTVAIQHAVNELVTNTIDHAYRDSAGPGHTLTITAALTPAGRLRAEVRDHGRWREPKPSADRGLGLTLVSGLSESLRVTHDESGTTVVVERQLSRPARLLTVGELGSGAARPQPDPADLFLVLDQPSAPSPRIRIDGAIDAGTTAQLEKAIRAAASAGTRDLTVDLTGVTLLASAGVSALHKLVALSTTHGSRLRLYAPPGSAADTVMTLISLPHVTADPDEADSDLSIGG